MTGAPVIAPAVEGAPVARDPGRPGSVVACGPDEAGPSPGRFPVAPRPAPVAVSASGPDETGFRSRPPKPRNPDPAGSGVAVHPKMARPEVERIPVSGDEGAVHDAPAHPAEAGSADAPPVAERPIAVLSPVAGHPDEVHPVAGGNPVRRNPMAAREMTPLPHIAGPGAEAEKSVVVNLSGGVAVLPDVIEVRRIRIELAEVEAEFAGIGRAEVAAVLAELGRPGGWLAAAVIRHGREGVKCQKCRFPSH